MRNINDIHSYESVYETEKQIKRENNNIKRFNIDDRLAHLIQENSGPINSSFLEIFKYISNSPLEFLIQNLMLLYANDKRHGNHNLKN